MRYTYIIIIFILFVLIIKFNNILNFFFGNKLKLNYNFYNYKKVYPFLEKLKKNRSLIIKDINNINFIMWDDWPEKNIYNKDWHILPFRGFGLEIKKNCLRCPNIYKIIKEFPNLKTALLSRLKSGTKIKPHIGWASLSNHILRCHYVIYSNNLCNIIVNNENKQVNEDDIIIFDDSKLHYAENNGKSDKIVLILDFLRPNYIKKGLSTVQNSSNLDNYINKFRNK